MVKKNTEGVYISKEKKSEMLKALDDLIKSADELDSLF